MHPLGWSRTRPSFSPRKITATLLAVLALGAASLTARAANILWVSDAPPGTANNSVFSGPGTSFTDQGFVKLLQDAGHNVNRMNTPDSGATNITVAELAAMNTNDLIIVGRAAGSAGWQNNQATNWNRDVTRPVVIMSPYLVRTDGNRVGWFGGGNGVLPDSTPAPLTPGLSGHPVIDYIFQDVPTSGTNTTELFEEPMDRNTSLIANPPVAGALVIATATFAREDNLAIITNANVIVGFPAGTVVRGGFDVLPAYRMFWGGGTRESATALNVIPLYTGRENLTPTGERVFLRSIEIALNSGVAPTTNDGPAGISSQPANVTVPQDTATAFSVTATGATPRLVFWQRGDGVGGFTNIPNTESVLTKSTLKIPVAGLTDSGAQFQAVVSNSLIMATSDVVTLTVTADTDAPLVLGAASLDGLNIVVCYNELVQPGTAGDAGNYQINGGLGPDVSLATMRPDGRSVNLLLLSPMGSTATVDVLARSDNNGNFSADPVTLTATNYGLTGVDVGVLNPVGANVACDANSFSVTGGGLDMASTADFLRFVYKNITGPFDARVRVVSFVGTNDHFETTAKAALTARETTANNSTAVNIFITPAAPGDNNIVSNFRGAIAAVTNSLGASVPRTTSNTWLRIRRVGSAFTTYHSTNGTDWVTYGTATTVFGPTMSVGVGVVSHRNGKVVTGTFSDFTIVPVLLPTMLTNSVPGVGTFTSSFQTQNGFSYTVEYKDDLNLVPWTWLETIPGDGTLKTFTDLGPASLTGTRVYRVNAQ